MPYDPDDDPDAYDRMRDAFDVGDSDVPMNGRQRRQYEGDRLHYEEERRYWRR